MELLNLLMSNPIAQNVAGGVFTQIITSSAIWVKDKFNRHPQISQQTAKENTAQFLHFIAERIKHLEDSESRFISIIESAWDHPEYQT